VEIIADRGINAKVTQEVWENAVASLIEAIKDGRPASRRRVLIQPRPEGDVEAAHPAFWPWRLPVKTRDDRQIVAGSGARRPAHSNPRWVVRGAARRAIKNEKAQLGTCEGVADAGHPLAGC
jgi:hypothetical protein